MNETGSEASRSPNARSDREAASHDGEVSGADSSSGASVDGLDDVLITAELARRSSRPPEFEAENRALVALAGEMAGAPRTILQKLVDTVLDLCRAGSAGISILEPGGAAGLFRWHAVAGPFAVNSGGTIPRAESPCGVVIARDSVLLLDRAERRFPALSGIEPPVFENLLAPFHMHGKPVGTVWAIGHTPERRFDAEDARLLSSLARFASAAYQMIRALDDADAKRQELERRIDEGTRDLEALRASEERFRVLTTSIPQLVFRSRGTGKHTWDGPQWKVYTGLSGARSRAFGWLDAVHPDDRKATLDAWKRAKVTGAYHAEHRIRRSADGEYRWHQTRAAPIRDGQGGTAEWIGTSTDVHEIYRLQQEQKVLVAELQHRTRNLLAVVRAIASQTLQTTASLGAFRTEFSDRLTALARVQGLLSRSRREPITIGALVDLELDALGAGAARARITLEGPEVPLRDHTVQMLALALHELATNARKYGALADDRGRISVTWRVREADGEGWDLVLRWIESRGGRRNDPAPQRHGFGRELIEKALPLQLDATTRFELDEGGVRCVIELPLARNGKREAGR